MPDTRPGIVFDEEGVCSACRHYEQRARVDWDQRWRELEVLADRYRSDDGSPDCLIAGSGGKDSHFQVYVFKELLGMHPLIVSVVDPFGKTVAGERNFHNIREAFGCHTLALHLDPQACRKMVRIAFEEFGSPTWPVDRAIYSYPLNMAIRLGIPLVIYGENISYEYGGPEAVETPSALGQINNNVAIPIDFDFWRSRGIEDDELHMLEYPSRDNIEAAGLNPLYLSYFTPWDGRRNFEIARKRGFRDLSHEWHREGYIEHYDQIDSVAYLVHPWLKYPKFGHARATDVACYWIRSGLISRDEGIRLVEENDHKLDQKALDDFLNFCGYSDKEFWDVVEKYWNRDLFEKSPSGWVLKDPVYKQAFPR